MMYMNPTNRKKGVHGIQLHVCKNKMHINQKYIQKIKKNNLLYCINIITTIFFTFSSWMATECIKFKVAIIQKYKKKNTASTICKKIL